MEKIGQTDPGEDKQTSALHNEEILQEALLQVDPTKPNVRGAVERSLKRVEDETNKNLESMRKIIKKSSQKSEETKDNSNIMVGETVPSDSAHTPSQPSLNPLKPRVPTQSAATHKTIKSEQTNMTKRSAFGKSYGASETMRSGKSILKNNKKNQRFPSKRLEILERENSSTNGVKKQHVPQSNIILPSRSWSVTSFDSCTGDSRRIYKEYIAAQKAKGRKYPGSFTYAVFLDRSGKSHPIPRHLAEEDDFEEAYGPVHEEGDEDTSAKKGKKIGLSLGLGLFRSTSQHTAKSSRKSLRKTLRQRFTLRNTKKMVSTSRSLLKPKAAEEAKKYHMSTLLRVPPPESLHGGDNSVSHQDADAEPAASKHSDDEEDKGTVIYDYAPTEPLIPKIVPKITVEKTAPKNIPVDMVWDNKQKRLVNKPIPESRLPVGKVWSRKAKSGMGGVVNKPPVAVEPEMIWSTYANNGQGGIVNRPPRNIPKGCYWDAYALGGLGKLENIPGWTKTKSKRVNAKERAPAFEFDIESPKKTLRKKEPGTQAQKQKVRKTIRRVRTNKTHISLLDQLETESMNITTQAPVKPDTDAETRSHHSVKSTKSTFSVKSVIKSVLTGLSGSKRNKTGKSKKAKAKTTLRKSISRTLRSTLFPKKRGSQVSLASTQIMEEAGLQFGHVAKLQGRFERMSLGDRAYDDLEAAFNEMDDFDEDMFA